jgi:predicted ATP-dependent serine protease
MGHFSLSSLMTRLRRVAMVVALISLALRMPLLPRLALTGEVSLNGRILGVGGILHKLIGAHRDSKWLRSPPKCSTV